MTFSELLQTVVWPETKAALAWNYPNEAASLDDYRLVLTELRKLTPTPSDTRIVLRKVPGEEPDDTLRIDVSGRDGRLNRDQEDFKYIQDTTDAAYANAETEYSLCLEPWEHWLGMSIDMDTLKQFTASQIVAHCLWEMTFHGFDRYQIKEVADELKRRIEEIDAMTEEEKKVRLIPWEEVKKEFEQ